MTDKLKPLIKAAKKTAQKNIQQMLVTQLTDITAKLGVTSKKLDKKIAKESKKLAKKFAKDIKFDKTLLNKTEDKPAIAEAPSNAAPAKVSQAPIPVVKKPVAKISAS
jgi:hypothetical protein